MTGLLVYDHLNGKQQGTHILSSSMTLEAGDGRLAFSTEKFFLFNILLIVRLLLLLEVTWAAK